MKKTQERTHWWVEPTKNKEGKKEKEEKNENMEASLLNSSQMHESNISLRSWLLEILSRIPVSPLN
jgi:hypothetical protein